MNPTALSTEPALAAEPPKVQNVEDFIPEDGLDRHFLEDTGPSKDKLPVAATPAAQDSDRYSEVTEWYLRVGGQTPVPTPGQVPAISPDPGPLFFLPLTILLFPAVMRRSQEGTPWWQVSRMM